MLGPRERVNVPRLQLPPDPELAEPGVDGRSLMPLSTEALSADTDAATLAAAEESQELRAVRASPRGRSSEARLDVAAMLQAGMKHADELLASAHARSLDESGSYLGDWEGDLALTTLKDLDTGQVQPLSSAGQLHTNLTMLPQSSKLAQEAEDSHTPRWGRRWSIGTSSGGGGSSGGGTLWRGVAMGVGSLTPRTTPRTASSDAFAAVRLGGSRTRSDSTPSITAGSPARTESSKRKKRSPTVEMAFALAQAAAREERSESGSIYMAIALYKQAARLTRLALDHPPPNQPHSPGSNLGYYEGLYARRAARLEMASEPHAPDADEDDEAPVSVSDFLSYVDHTS